MKAIEERIEWCQPTGGRSQIKIKIFEQKLFVLSSRACRDYISISCYRMNYVCHSYHI